jgi:hypothetical protein
VARLLMPFALTVAASVEITDQSAETSPTGEAITVTATVTDQFASPFESAEVHFRAEGDGVTPAETQTAFTDPEGQAAFTFTSTDEETVTVTAWIDGPGGNFVAADGDSSAVEKTFTAAGG